VESGEDGTQKPRGHLPGRTGDFFFNGREKGPYLTKLLPSRQKEGHRPAREEKKKRVAAPFFLSYLREQRKKSTAEGTLVGGLSRKQIYFLHSNPKPDARGKLSPPVITNDKILASPGETVKRTTGIKHQKRKRLK